MVDVAGGGDDDVGADEVRAVESAHVLFSDVGDVVPDAEGWLAEEVIAIVGEVGGLDDDAGLVLGVDALAVDSLALGLDLGRGVERVLQHVSEERDRLVELRGEEGERIGLQLSSLLDSELASKGVDIGLELFA